MSELGFGITVSRRATWDTTWDLSGAGQDVALIWYGHERCWEIVLAPGNFGPQTKADVDALPRMLLAAVQVLAPDLSPEQLAQIAEVVGRADADTSPVDAYVTTADRDAQREGNHS